MIQTDAQSESNCDLTKSNAVICFFYEYFKMNLLLRVSTVKGNKYTLFVLFSSIFFRRSYLLRNLNWRYLNAIITWFGLPFTASFFFHFIFCKSLHRLTIFFFNGEREREKKNEINYREWMTSYLNRSKCCGFKPQNEIKLPIVLNVSCEVIYFRGFHWFSIFFFLFFILTQTTPLCLPFSVILLLLFRYSKKWFSFDLCYSEMKVYKEIKKKSERRRLAEIEKKNYIFRIISHLTMVVYWIPYIVTKWKYAFIQNQLNHIRRLTMVFSVYWSALEQWCRSSINICIQCI